MSSTLLDYILTCVSRRAYNNRLAYSLRPMLNGAWVMQQPVVRGISGPVNAVLRDVRVGIVAKVEDRHAL
jgi:hypothetical protein